MQHASEPLCLSSHLGALVAKTAGDDGSVVQVWDKATGSVLVTYAHHHARVRALSFSPDDERLAIASIDGSVTVVSARRTGPILTFTGHSDWALSVAFSPDGTRVASGSFDQTVQVWALEPVGDACDQAADTVREEEFEERTDRSQGLVGTLAHLQVRRLATYRGHESAVHLLAWSPDGRLIASADLRGEIRVWLYDADLLAGHTPTSLLALTADGGALAFAWSPDARYLALVPATGQVEIWSMGTGQLCALFRDMSEVVWPDPAMEAATRTHSYRLEKEEL
jgi:eukaryotic-like serine/threonine-protein kinase